ncbi:MAG: hypothetical protein IJR66_05035 [Clostridia bacterium]|nr:hypothetical protein [Clostridia bacterium]MBQ9514321.1 hypothetical protein [Clostridia bacterium]
MIFYYNANGDSLGVFPESVYQGSKKANSLYFICPISRASVVSAVFVLPDGQQTVPYQMDLLSSEEFTGVNDAEGNAFNVWSKDLPASITEQVGNVSVSFRITNASDEIITTVSSFFYVEEGVLVGEIEESDAYQEVLDSFASFSQRLVNVENAFSPILVIGATEGNDAVLADNCWHRLGTKSNFNIVERITATVDGATFDASSIGGTDGQYAFTYDAETSAWKYDDTDADLSDYGITVASDYDYINGDTVIVVRATANNTTTITVKAEPIYTMDFVCLISFVAGANISCSYPQNIKWSGDDVVANVFTPIYNKRYTITFFNDNASDAYGTIQATVRGV